MLGSLPMSDWTILKFQFFILPPFHKGDTDRT